MSMLYCERRSDAKEAKELKFRMSETIKKEL